MPSFDVVSKIEMQEVDNAVNQAKKELSTRYDFKGSKSSITLEADEITLLADDSLKLKALTEILNQRMVKRGVAIRSLEYKEVEKCSGDMLKQKIKLIQGISTEDARKMVKLIKDQKLKSIQAQIQQDQLRVSGQKKDDLQKVIQLLKEKVDLELQFVNYRD